MNTTTENITPAIAQKYLSTMTEKQRPLRHGWVKCLAAHINEGTFIMTHQAIAFDEHGRLFDGQHRLWAIITANKSVRMLVTRGVQETAWHATDIGMKRSYADITGLDKRVAEAIRCVLFICKSRATFAAETLLNVAQSKFGKTLEDLISATPTTIRIFSSATVRSMAALRAAKDDTKDYVFSQYRALIHQAFDEMSPSVQAFYRQRNAGISAMDRIDLACRAFIAFDKQNAHKERITIKDMTKTTEQIRSHFNEFAL